MSDALYAKYPYISLPYSVHCTDERDEIALPDVDVWEATSFNTYGEAVAWACRISEVWERVLVRNDGGTLLEILS